VGKKVFWTEMKARIMGAIQETELFFESVVFWSFQC
jgi:hypothetical protein